MEISPKAEQRSLSFAPSRQPSVAGYGYWMPTLRVVESGICTGGGGFGLGGEGILGGVCHGFAGFRSRILGAEIAGSGVMDL